VEAELEGDAFFPVVAKQAWLETSRQHHPKDERHHYAFDFVTYQRK
jgi:dihydrofolate reductase